MNDAAPIRCYEMPRVRSGKTLIITAERGSRVIVGEHPTEVYLSIEHTALFLNPIDAFSVAMALVEFGANALDRQREQSAAAGRGSAAEIPLSAAASSAGDAE